MHGNYYCYYFTLTHTMMRLIIFIRINPLFVSIRRPFPNNLMTDQSSAIRIYLTSYFSDCDVEFDDTKENILLKGLMIIVGSGPRVIFLYECTWSVSGIEILLLLLLLLLFVVVVRV